MISIGFYRNEPTVWLRNGTLAVVISAPYHHRSVFSEGDYLLTTR